MVTAVALFVAATAIVLAVGPRMARVADRLGEVTGLGGGLFGLVFLALATDLPEVALTPAAVLGGHPKLAVGGLLGSAAAQLAMIAAVDIAFRRGKLYANVPLRSSLGQCAVMLAVLAVPLVAASGTPAIGWISVATLTLPAAYLGLLLAIRGLSQAGDGDSTGPSKVDDVADGPAEPRHSMGWLWLRFGTYAVLLAGAGIALEAATETLGPAIGLEETAAGALLAGVATSLPELVTAVAAARAGALELAVGDIVGSSALDVTLLSWADIFYRDGSVFELLGAPEFTLLGVALALTTLLVVGLARREPVGSPNVGVETYLMLGVYVAGALVLIGANG